MLLDLDKLKNGCPEKIKEELDEITTMSRKFVGCIDIHPNQELEEVKIEVQSAKDYLFQIMSRFLTLISNMLEEETEIRKIGLRLKFEEDIGSVIRDLKEKNTGKVEGLIGITALLKFAGELKTTYDFLIYHPITLANKNNKNKDVKDYMKDMFKTLRANASILGYAGKFTLTPSKQILPRPISMIASNLKPKSLGGEEQMLEGLGEDEEGVEDD